MGASLLAASDDWFVDAQRQDAKIGPSDEKFVESYTREDGSFI